ncbi:LysR family transcriptional regulator [Bradyrhizobium sp. STM 3557]|uniref:LysR family transcriptional regulator n=1 Tax=Bradyrhizobium sp. STM 3557 TaxID=578920 RepID=UPI00388FAD62
MDQVAAFTTFVRVVEAGSLSAAARSLPASLTAVSRQIAALEAHYGTTLLLRTTRQLALTDAGRLLYDRAKAVIAELRDVELALSSQDAQLSGRLRVSAPSLMGRLLIAPLLADFLRLHPDVSVDLLLVDRPVNLLEEDVHAALRIGRLPDSQAVARKLAELTMIVCAAPSYLQRRGTPATPADLAGHDCLVFSDVPGGGEWRFRMPDGTSATMHLRGRLWINSLDALAAAARDGAGLVRVPSWQVADDIEAGTLTRVLADYELPASAVHVVMPPARLGSPRTRAFVDFLALRWRSNNPLRALAVS